MDAPPIFPIPRWSTRLLRLVAGGFVLLVVAAFGIAVARAAKGGTFRCYFPPSDAAFALTLEWEAATRERWVAPHPFRVVGAPRGDPPRVRRIPVRTSADGSPAASWCGIHPCPHRVRRCGLRGADGVLFVPPRLLPRRRIGLVPAKRRIRELLSRAASAIDRRGVSRRLSAEPLVERPPRILFGTDPDGGRSRLVDPPDGVRCWV